MTEARDIERAGLVIAEVVRGMRADIEALKEERRMLDWTVERIREERVKWEEARQDAER